MTVGIAVPMVITSNKGFNIVGNSDCGLRDLVIDVLEPFSEYLRIHQQLLAALIAISSFWLDFAYLMVCFSIARRRKLKYVYPFAIMYFTRFIIQ